MAHKKSETLAVRAPSPARHSKRTLTQKPISYQEPSEEEFLPDEESVDLEPLKEDIPEISPKEEEEEPKVYNEEQLMDPSFMISEFLASPFSATQDTVLKPTTLMDFEGKLKSRPGMLLKTDQPSTTTVNQPMVFQGYDFNLLSHSLSSEQPQFPKDEFLPFHIHHSEEQHHPSVLSTDACLHALGTSLSALQGLPEDQLDSMDPFDLFFEVPKSPTTSSSEVSSSSDSHEVSLVKKNTQTVQLQTQEKAPLESSIDPTWDENLLLGGGHLADYFAQIEDQYLL
jgi:hypothetical protein